MKALFEKIPLEPGESLACREFRVPAFTAPWHFHPECELTLIVQGRGTRYVGDAMDSFEDGDLVLLGSHLPHYWWKDASDRREARSVVLQFDETFAGKRPLDLPEAAGIRELLQAARRGIVFRSAVRSALAQDLVALPRLRGWDRLCAVLSLLGRMAEAKPWRTLASAGYVPQLDEDDGRRLTAVCRYVHAYSQGVVSQPRAAALAGRSPAGFSRYFHRRMGRTFEAYVNEVRIGQACRMLQESERTVAEVAFACGFNNLSNFNRRFRQFRGTTPTDFRHRVSRGRKLE